MSKTQRYSSKEIWVALTLIWDILLLCLVVTHYFGGNIKSISNAYSVFFGLSIATILHLGFIYNKFNTPFCKITRYIVIIVGFVLFYYIAIFISIGILMSGLGSGSAVLWIIIAIILAFKMTGDFMRS